MASRDRRKRAKHSRDYMGVGSVRVRRARRSNGQPYEVRFIKVAFKGPSRWKRYATHLWETTHGPVPDGHMVVHLDGDSLNDDLDNLAVLSPGEVITWRHRVDQAMSRNNRRGDKRLDAVRTFNREIAAVRRQREWLPRYWYAVDHQRRVVFNTPYKSRRRLLADWGYEHVAINGGMSRKRVREVEKRLGIVAVRGSKLAADELFRMYRKVGNSPVVKAGVTAV